MNAIFLDSNIQSLRFHHADLVVFLDTLEQKPDVITLMETWLKDSDQSDNYDLPGYQTIASKQRKNAKGRSGGAVLYIRDDLQYTIQNTNTKIECLILQVKYNENCLLNFCVIYRPPSLKLTDFEPKLENFLPFLKFLKEEILVFGDFYIDILKREKSTKCMRILLDHLISKYKTQCLQVLPKIQRAVLII